MPKLDKKTAVKREEFAFHLFMEQPDITGKEANDTIRAKFPRQGMIRHKTLYRLREEARAILKSENKWREPDDKRLLSHTPAPKVETIDTPPTNTQHAPRSPEAEVMDLGAMASYAVTPREEHAALVRIDTQEQGQFLRNILDILRGHGLTEAKIVHTMPNHILVAGPTVRS